LLGDMRVLRALEPANGVPPEIIRPIVCAAAWRRRRAIVCAHAMYWGK
jgi:hypothetical protein